MGAKVSVLPSKIVQIVNIPNSNYYSAWLLCDDGSLWVKANTAAPIFDQVHPPHQPPTHAADLAEAVSLMWNLLFRTSLKGGKYKAASQQARDDARAFLKRMG